VSLWGRDQVVVIRTLTPGGPTN